MKNLEHPAVSIVRTDTCGEIAEQLRIIDLGGVENLENIRNPIGSARANLLPQSAKDFLGY